MISKPPSVVLKQLLIDEGEVLAPGGPATVWPIFVSKLPDGDQVPSNAIAIYDTEVLPDGRIMLTGERIEHPGIQIRARSVDYPTGYVKLMAIAAILDGVQRQSVTVDAVDYVVQSVSRFGGVLQLGTDESGREGFTINATVTITELP